MTDKDTRKGPKILVAGAGIGGLVLAVGLLKKGFDVQIFERDLTAIRGEGKYRGPIQVTLSSTVCNKDPPIELLLTTQGYTAGAEQCACCTGGTGHRGCPKGF